MEPVGVLATVLLIAGIVAKVIERIRVRFPRLDGDVITLVSVVIGTAVAWGYQLDVSAEIGQSVLEPFNWLVTGLFIGGGAGLVADLTGSSVRVASARGDTTGPDGLPADG